MKKKRDERAEKVTAEAVEPAVEEMSTAEAGVEESSTAADAVEEDSTADATENVVPEAHAGLGKTEEVLPAAEVPQEKKIPEGGNVMYVGHSIQNLIRYGTVFAGGVLPEKVSTAVAEFPAAAKLFVPVEEIPDAMKSLHEKNSALAAIRDRMVRKYSKR